MTQTAHAHHMDFTTDLSPPTQPMADKHKSSAAFRTIGEVAAELALPPHVLRFWESKFTQIKPHKRRGGHRYYRPSDVETIKEIKTLLYEKGYTIRGVQKYYKDNKSSTTQQATMFADEPKTSTVRELPLERKDIHRLKKILNGLEELKALLKESA